MIEKPRLFVTRHMPPAVAARAERDYRVVQPAVDSPPSAEEILALAQGSDAILTSPTERFDARVIHSLPESVQMMATFSVGHEHIDLEAAKARGIRISNTPDVLNDATADTAMLLLLAAARRAHEGAALLREGRWQSWSTTLLCGVHLGGKRLGILGMGRIGRAVAQRARGFGLEIHYHNRSRLAPELEDGAVYHEDPEALLPLAQFLSLNFPASPETNGFLNERRIALLPDKAVVVNTARGSVVDDDALIAALRSGKVFAAGLDVFNGEPNLDPRYRTIENAFLLPHVGSATIETRNDMGFCCLDNLDAFFAGRPLPNALV